MASLIGKAAGAVPATTAVASVGGVTITAGGLKEALDVLQAVQDKLEAFAASPSIDGALDVTEAVFAELNELGIAGAKLDETVIIIAKAVYDASQNANGDYSGTIVTYPHRAK